MLLLKDEKLDIMGRIHELVGMAMVMNSTMELNQKQWKEDIRQKWEESKKLPRKKKKEERKSLLIEWSIASWSPLDDMGRW